MQHAIPYRTFPVVPSPGSPVRRGGASSAVINGNTSSSSSSSASSSSASSSSRSGIGKDVKELISENAVIVFGKKGCCMCHVVKRLFVGLGVNPAVYDVDEEEEAHLNDELISIAAASGGSGGGGGGKISDQQKRPQLQFPAVFIGGRLFGGLDRLMNAHITGELIPILKKAGALWL